MNVYKTSNFLFIKLRNYNKNEQNQKLRSQGLAH